MTQPIIFISYSHKDEREKDKLLSHLRVLQSGGLVSLWSDDRIGAGADWESEIRAAMSQARVAILIISADFLTSDFILGQEVPTLLKRRKSEGLTVFPVIAKACAWQEVGWLTGMNVRPKNGRPIWGAGNRRVNEDLAAIAKEVAAIIKPSPSMTSAVSSVYEKSERADIEMGLEDTNKMASQTSSKDPGASSQKAAPIKSTIWGLPQVWWVSIVVALIGLIGVIIPLAINNQASTSQPFIYAVRVQIEGTNQNIPNAKVTIEVAGQAPLDEITDSNGFTRITINTSYIGKPGRLLVEASGYEAYRQEIDLTEGNLPDTIPLEQLP